MPVLIASSHDEGLLDGLLALPIHPIFIHFPIALLSLVWVLVALRHWRNTDHLETYIQPALAVGVSILPVVVLTGLRDADWSVLFTDIDWRRPLVWHFITAITTSMVFVAYFFYRRRRLEAGTLTRRADINFATAGFWLLLMTGLIAGEMVYG